MLKNFKILTVTHRQTNLKEIGQFVLQNSEEQTTTEQLEQLQQQFQIEELLYLATCNRVMYLMYFPTEINHEWICDFVHQVNPSFRFSDEKLLQQIQFKEGADAIEHLFEVAASVDSMVIGEREILRQLRDAYNQCKDWGSTKDNIRLLMRYTVESAKSVYAQTRIGEKPVSVVSLAIKKLLETNLSKDARILLIGAGQTNALVAKFLKKHDFNNVHVFNRSIAPAKQLAQIVSGKASTLQQLQHFEGGFDAMIVCTGATQAIIDKTLYQQLLQEDTSKKVVLDLSIPNNVAKEVIDNFPVHYIEIEGLRTLSNENKAFRAKEISKVKILLKERLSEFEYLYQQRKIERAMRHVPTKIKAVKEKAINEIFRKQLADIDEDALKLIHEMMNYMERRCISIPMQAAKNTVS